MDEIIRELQKYGLMKELSWEGDEYEFAAKDRDWFLIFGTIAGLLIVVALLLGNFLLAGIILIGAFLLASYNRQPPKTINFEIGDGGIRIGHELYPYSKLHSFWVDPQTEILTIESQRLLHPHISLPLGTIAPEAARSYLLKKIPEKKYQGSVADFVTQFFGF